MPKPTAIAVNTYHKKGDYDRAIADYNKAIELNPNLAEAYNNRGTVWLHLEDWEKARFDLTVAKAIGADIVTEFRNDYESIPDFERKHGLKLPDDIAEMLTPPAA